MPSRSLRTLLIATLVVGPLGFLGGCGGSGAETHVTVDKEKEAAALKSMGDFYAKKQGKAKGKPIR